MAIQTGPKEVKFDRGMEIRLGFGFKLVDEDPSLYWKWVELIIILA